MPHNILCTTRETGKRTLHSWWRISGQQVFYPAIKRKTEKEKEGGNSQPSKKPEKDNTELCIIFLILYLRLNQTQIGERLEGVDIKHRKLNLAK